MAHIGKKSRAARKTVDRKKRYGLDEAIQLMKKAAFANFDEAVEMAVRLGIDPRKGDQQVRGTVVLPHGTGKKARVLVFAKGEKEVEAREAGADYVGAEDLIEKIREGWLDFDKVIATPDMMGQVGKLGKLLGPRGLMPNPKLGTVTFDVSRAVQEIKTGKVEFRAEKAGVVHAAVGRRSFSDSQLSENVRAFVETVVRAKPAASKGQYLRSITLSTTMGPGMKLEIGQFAGG